MNPLNYLWIGEAAVAIGSLFTFFAVQAHRMRGERWTEPKA